MLMKSRIMGIFLGTVVVLMTGVLAVTTIVLRSGVNSSIGPFLQASGRVAGGGVSGGIQLDSKDEVAAALEPYRKDGLFTYLRVRKTGGAEVYFYRKQGLSSVQPADDAVGQELAGEMFHTARIEAQGTPIGSITLGI